MSEAVGQKLFEAIEWLSSTLETGPQKTVWLRQQAKNNGISEKTLRRAREKIGIKSYKHRETWYLRAPEELQKFENRQKQQRGWSVTKASKAVPLMAFYRRYKKGADARLLPFELNFNEFFEMVISPCAFCEAPPALRVAAETEFHANGIDRLDSTFGYTKDNTVPCCSQCNYAKGALNAPDFISWAKRIGKVIQ